MIVKGDVYIVATEDPETVDLSLTPRPILVSPFNVQQEPLQISVKRVVGADRTPLECYLLLRVKSIGVVLDTIDLGKVSDTTYTIPQDRYPNATTLEVTAYNDANHASELKTEVTSITCNELPDPYYRGESWTYTDSFRNGDYLVHEVNGQSSIYMWASRVMGNTKLAPWDKNISAMERDYWVHVTEKSLFATKILMAKGALLGSAVFDGDFTISQQGKSKGTNPATGKPYTYQDFTADMSKFEPNIVIDWLKGKFRGLEMEILGNSTFSGELNGVSGSFRRLVCKDDKGTVVGGVSFSAYDDNTNYITIDGNLELYGGDFRHNGEKDGRPLRFLSSNLWCRGNFGAKCRTVAYVTGDTASYYINGLDKPAVSVTLRAGNYNGRLHREVRLNGVGDLNNLPIDVWGCPIDMVVFNVDKTTYYDLVMSDSQRAMVINASNSGGGEVHIYSHGTLVKWVGGDVAEVIKLPNNFLSPSQGVVPGQGLFIGAFRDNNW